MQKNNKLEINYWIHTFLFMSERMKNLALRSIEAFIHGSTLKLDGKPGGHRNLKYNNKIYEKKNLFSK